MEHTGILRTKHMQSTQVEPILLLLLLYLALHVRRLLQSATTSL